MPSPCVRDFPPSGQAAGQVRLRAVSELRARERHSQSPVARRGGGIVGALGLCDQPIACKVQLLRDMERASKLGSPAPLVNKIKYTVRFF